MKTKLCRPASGSIWTPKEGQGPSMPGLAGDDNGEMLVCVDPCDDFGKVCLLSLWDGHAEFVDAVSFGKMFEHVLHEHLSLGLRWKYKTPWCRTVKWSKMDNRVRAEAKERP